MKKLLSFVLTIAMLLSPLGAIMASAATLPNIQTSLHNMDYVSPNTVITVSYSAASGKTLTSCDTRLDGKSISNSASFSFKMSDFADSYGSYTLVMEAVDSSGNVNRLIRVFVYTSNINIDFTYNENEDIVPSVDGATASVHKVTSLKYDMGYGVTTNGNINVGDETLYTTAEKNGMQYYGNAIETTSASGIPYNTFNIDLNGQTDGEVAVRYTGSTFAGERIALKVYNPTTKAWDELGTMCGSDSVSAAVDVATYNNNGSINVVAVLDYVTNGSDTMIWSTDPQHYTKFDDLNEYYYTVYKFAANEYLNGNAGYIITTGDLVDDLPTTSSAVKQWKVADKAMSYVEAVGMPNGLVSGNHDVGTFSKNDYSSGASTVNYTKYLEYFDASRYNDKKWYGGSINNNISHYDLITIGNVDFVVVYLGYGVEATDETIQWANDVLETYSHRVGIIATHEYLDASTADRADKSRANLMYNKIVDPNPNVKVVLCGHDDGAIVNAITASDGRTVYEILSDYQFVEAEDEDFYANEHYIGSVPHCCGDGYIRLMTVSGDTLSSVTYSPVTGKYNPYGDRESFSIDLDYTPSRSISAVSFSAYTIGDEIAPDEPSYMFENAIVITGPDSTTYHHVSYIDYPAEYTFDVVANPDRANLNALITEASTLNTSDYTTASVNNLKSALEQAKASSDTSYAYALLANAMGALEKKKTSIDASTLKSVHNYTMTVSNWSSSDASISQKGSGIYMVRASGNTNGWASMSYKGSSYKIRPNDGRIYMNLDVVANSAWCILIGASQGDISTSFRMNFAIDNAFHNTTADSYNGVYKGVYDVTEAFVQAGMDPTATITITGMSLFIVPGDVTYTRVEYLTGKTAPALDTSMLASTISKAKILDKSLYSSASWSKLTSAITNAESVKSSATHQADINLALKILNDAIDQLKPLADVVPEPIGSFLPADEGNWVPNASGVMNIYRDDNKVTVLNNTNGQWPYADHTFSTPLTASRENQQISVDITVADKTNILFFVPEIGNGGAWVPLPKYISSAKTNNDGDLTAGTYTADIRLADITELAGKDTFTITKVRVFAVGASGASSAVTIRRLQLTEYVAPPKVEDVKYDILANAENFTVVSGDGTAEIKNGVLTIVNNGDGDLRVNFTTSELYNLKKLNAIHLDIDSGIPFKIAFQAQSTNDSAAWQNTSAAVYSNLFTLQNDRVAAGEYDTYLEFRDNASGITDKSAVFYNSFIVLVTGKGTFKLNLAEAVAYDTFEWPEGPSYGRPATPDANYFEHAATTAPEVENMVDLIPYFNSGTHPTVGSSTIETANGLGLDIDISKTPYLYYSFAVCDGADFTFSIYSNATYSPWLSFLDSNKGDAVLNSTNANWESYKAREQYSKVSQTGCIDMRQYLVDPNVQKWVISQMKLYKPTTGTTVVSYLFFGSESLSEYPPMDESSEDVSEETSDDVSDDVSTEASEDPDDLNGDGIPDSYLPTIDGKGEYVFDNAYGFEFEIDDIDGKITGEDDTLITNADSYAGCNPNWAISVVLDPTAESGVYTVTKVVVTPGSAANANIEWNEGTVVLVVHSAYSNEQGENWMPKVAAIAVKPGDIVTFNNNKTLAVVSKPEIDDSSDDVSDDPSEEPSDDPSEDVSDDPSEDPSIDDSSDEPSEDPSIDDSSDDISDDNSDDTTDDPSDDPSVDPEPEIMRGDVDGNGEVDQMDYLLVKRAYFETYALDEDAQKRADVDQSGKVDQMDYLCIKRAYFGTYVIG